MGEAKRRGTFEERKAEAIKAGRVRVKFSQEDFRKEVQELLLQTLFSKYIVKVSKNR